MSASRTSAQTVGAPVPFTEFNAATSSGVQTNGTVLGPNYNFGTLASEATGRQAVLLVGQGSYVSFTLTAPANAITVHYAIPDAPAGNGLNEPLSLYTNNSFVTALPLTSEYSWLYGTYTFTKTPGIGMPGFHAPHDFYNDVRYLFPSTLPAGTVVKLQVDAADLAPWYLINTADFELVPAPISEPAGAIDVTSSTYGADPSGSKDSTTAIQNAINAAEGSTASPKPIVWLPAGTYTISSPLNVNNVTIDGAGEWYTVLTGTHVEFSGSIGGASTNVNVSNLAIFGNVAVRNDSDGSVNGFNGGFSNSNISNIWIQNTKVGAWIVGPATNLTFNNLRIMDLKADGINFDGGVSSSTIENSFFRNTQDDGMALWSQSADTNDTLTQNTVDSPGLANNVAVYGSGSGVVISNNLLQDTVTQGGGIHVGQRFNSVPMSGTLTIQNNTIVRAGQFDPGFFFGVGAIWFWPDQGNLNSTVNLTGNTIQNSPYPAIQFLGPDSTTNVTISNTTITNVGTFVFAEQGAGSAIVSNTTATGVGVAGIFNQSCSSGFTLNETTGDSGFSTTTCNYPTSAPLWVYPDLATFQTSVGTPVTTQIAVINKAEETASLGAISASSGFTVSADPSYPCGNSLAAAQYGGANENGWCLIDVTFSASSSGITRGTLTIPNSESSTPVTVQLVGSTGGNTVQNPPQLSPTSLSFGYQLVGQASAAKTVTLKNPASASISVGSISVSSGYSQTNTCGSSLAAGASCSISVKFAPTTSGADNGTLSVSTSATGTPVTATLSGTGYTATTNLALSATATSSSNASGYPASDVNDGNTSTYWESLDGAAYPQWVDLNFGQALGMGSVTLNLPPSTSWSTRTETFSVQGSTDGVTYTTVVASASYTFNPSTGNTVSFNLPAGTTEEHLRLVFTANTGWSAAQVSEIQVFPGTSSCTAGTPTAPTGLKATAASSSQINLSWTASSTSGVTYSVFRSTTSGFTPSSTNQIAGSLSGTTYSDSGLAGSTTYYYLVQAVNCAGAASSGQASATTSSGVTPPSIPSGLTASAGNASVALSWSASTGTSPITYNVYRGTTSGGESATPIASNLSSTSYIDTSVTNGTTYYYEVSATNSAGTSGKSSEVKATPTAGSGNNPLLQIDAGGGATGTFVADEDFNNGNEYSTTTTVSTAGVANAAPEAVYQSVRWAPSFTYTISGLTSGQSYTVRLHFVELSFTASGQRVFNVAINGASVLSNFDVYAQAGGQYKALVEQFTATANSLGEIAISFSQGSADNPDVAGIEVLGSGSLGPAPPEALEIDAGSNTAVSPFVADEGFNTGNEFSSSSAVDTSHTSSPAPAAVYQTCRWASSFTYTITGLTGGAAYGVRLHFAELSWTAAGQRVFNVAINGTTVLSNFDIFATSGAQNRALTEQFNATANSSGTITISFTQGGADNPEVNGIEILK